MKQLYSQLFIFYSGLISVVLSFVPLGVRAQWLEYGTNEYVSLYHGELPIVLSVPHGGGVMPSSIPDRLCNDPVYAQDAFTIETANALSDALEVATGCRPYVVTCYLHRRKLDANRNLEDGACGQPAAELAWQEFHAFIAQAQTEAASLYNGRIFFIDLHGHGNPQQRIELGYLLYDDELELSDAVLNAIPYIDYSSIRTLAENNLSGSTHAQLLRGPTAMGTLLGNTGFPAVPSEQIPAPGINSNYFSGGYITSRHTCYSEGNTVSGLQMELNYTGVRDTEVHRAAFAEALVQILSMYYTSHIREEGTSCTSSNLSSAEESICTLFIEGTHTTWRGPCTSSNGTIQAFDAMGRLLATGRIVDNTVYFTQVLPEGPVWLTFSDGSRQGLWITR
jgi:hypothetical protein